MRMAKAEAARAKALRPWYEKKRGLAHARLDITNHSSDQSDYLVTVAFADNGVQIGTGTAFATDVDGGRRAVAAAVGAIANSTPKSMRCSVKSVDRTASF
jgi:hypothetical protein